MNRMTLSVVIFLKKVWSKHLAREPCLIGHFACICATISRQCFQFLYKRFTGALESRGSMGFLQVGKKTTHQCTKTLQRDRVKVHVFWQETLEVVRLLLSGTESFSFQYGYCWSHEHSHYRKTQSQRKLNHSYIIPKNSKKNEIYLAN